MCVRRVLNVYLCTEPGQVNNLEATFSVNTTFNSTSRMHTLDVNISWNEPINPNGVITAYSVTVYQTDDSSDVVYSNDAVTDLAVTESVMVLPFTDYTVTVAASTSAGQGDETTIIILSPEAGIELNIHHLYVYVFTFCCFFPLRTWSC